MPKQHKIDGTNWTYITVLNIYRWPCHDLLHVLLDRQENMEISMNHNLLTADLYQGCHHGNRLSTKPQEATTQTCDHCVNPLVTSSYDAHSDAFEIYLRFLRYILRNRIG